MHLSTSRLRLLVAALLVLVWVRPGSSAAETRFTAAARGPNVTCGACVVVDEAGRTLWARSARTPLPNASTTKMTTALVTVRSAELDEVATVSAAAGSVGGGGLDLQAGDQMTVHDLLYALLLSSSNEAAATLAEHVAGTQAAFVRRMNVTARRLGARDTRFANPHGLDQTGHYSSAADLARLGVALLDVPVLAEIVATARATIQTPRGPVEETNRNVLLESYEGAIGIKTGRTLGAGNVLVAAATRGDHTLVAVAMRAGDAASDAAALLDHGFRVVRRLERPRATTVITRGTSIGTLVFDPGGATSVVVADTVTLDLPPDGPRMHYELEPAGVEVPVATGDEVGTVRVVAAGKTIATAPVVAADAVGGATDPTVSNVLGTVIALVAVAVEAVT